VAKNNNEPHTLFGIGASPGIVTGKVIVLDIAPKWEKKTITDDEREKEKNRTHISPD